MYAAPVLLFAFPVLLKIEPLFVSAWPLFGLLLGLLLLCAWRATATGEAYLYFIGAFFAVAAQAVWSAEHLTVDRLRMAVALYAVFGVVTAGVPAVARRLGRTLEPEGAGGVMLLASLGLLAYLAAGPVAPAALWALALLLAILNAGIFIESAATRLPLTALCGTILSWIILAIWWTRAAAIVGVLPSLAVLTGLSLVTLAGYAWSYRQTACRAGTRGGELCKRTLPVAHRPPVPVFHRGQPRVGAAAVAAVRRPRRDHAGHERDVAGHSHSRVCTVLARLPRPVTVMAWTAFSAVGAWPTVGLAASAAVSLFALLWMTGAKRVNALPERAVAAAGVLFISELTVIVTTGARQPPDFLVILAANVANLAILLALSWNRRWANVAVWAALFGALGVLGWQAQRGNEQWKELLILSGTLYALFTAYPLVVGAARARRPRTLDSRAGVRRHDVLRGTCGVHGRRPGVDDRWRAGHSRPRDGRAAPRAAEARAAG